MPSPVFEKGRAVMTWPPVHAVAVVGTVLAAAVSDVMSRRIPNALTLGAAAVAIGMHGVLSGWSGVVFAVSGWAVGLALFFPLFALKGMGAGDVKLLAAIGAWLGPLGAVWTALYGAVAGGVMAVAVALARRYVGTAVRNLGTLLRSWRIAGVRPVEGLTLGSASGPRLPYALPLAAGAILTLWVR